MEIALQALPTSTVVHFNDEATFQEKAVESTTASTLLSFFRGRICKEWERSLITTMAVMKVAFAIFNTLTGGSWFFALFLLASVGVDSIAINKLRRSAATNRLLEQHQDNNHAQRNNVVRMGKKIIHLSALNEKYENLNAHHQQLNQVYADTTKEQVNVTAVLKGQVKENGGLIRLLRSVMDNSTANVKEALGKVVSHLEGFGDLASNFETKVETFGRLSGQLNNEFRTALKEQADAAQVFNKMQQSQVDRLLGLEERLTVVAEKLGNKEGALGAVKDELTATSAELRTVKDELNKATNKLKGVVDQAAQVAGDRMGIAPRPSFHTPGVVPPPIAVL